MLHMNEIFFEQKKNLTSSTFITRGEFEDHTSAQAPGPKPRLFGCETGVDSVLFPKQLCLTREASATNRKACLPLLFFKKKH
jgi:hypothetical protein